GVAQFGAPSGQVLFHHGQDHTFSVVRWTSPLPGLVNVSGFFGEGDVGTMSYYISLDGTTYQQWVNAPGTQNFAFSQNVLTNSTIDFIVGIDPFHEPYGFGTTPIPVDISFDAATPLPAALPLFATGLGVMGLLGWRRKRRTAAAA